MTATTIAAEPDVPFPPRYWWLKRLSAAFVLFVLGMVALWFAWSWYADRQLRAELRAIHDRGEPIYIEDFAPKPVPDELNGALSLENAAAAMKALPQNLRDFSGDFDFDYAPGAGARQLMGQLAAASSITRQLARTARAQPQTRWAFELSRPMGQSVPELRSQRELSRLLACVAYAEHLAGNDAEAVEIVRDMIAHADRVHECGPTFVSHLVALSLYWYATDTIRDIVPELSILPSGDATTLPTGAASRAQIQALIDALLDENALRRGYALAMNAERAYQHDVVESRQLPAYSMDDRALLAVASPATKLNLIQLLRATGQLGTVLSQRSYPEAIAAIPSELELQRATPTVPTLFCMFATRALSPYGRALETDFRVLAGRRVAAIRLAIRAYQLDHAGSLPESLNALAPTYLPSVPLDPYSAAARPFGYRTAAKPMVYSVGRDGRDDGGDPTSLRKTQSTAEPGSPQDSDAWDRKDLIFPLNQRLAAAPPPATEPAE